jgi:cellulose synthase (UDP-forming)
VDLRPFSNSLSFQLAFQMEKKGNCQDTTPINMMGAILRSSYIDLRGYPHWAALPNLELFANAGFPFTRFADLNETRVVLPDQPSSQEIEMYLTLMGHFGAQTGYPVLRVMLTGADAMHAGANADFLVIGTGKDNPAIGKLSATMPVTIEEGGLKVRDTAGFFAPLHNAWWKIGSNQDLAGGELSTAGMPDGLIEEMESPYSRHRTIVLVDAKDGSSVDPMMAGFLKVSQSGTITGSVAVVHGSEYQAYRIGTGIYHVGTLSSWTALGLWFMQVPWIIDLAVLAFSFFFAVTIRTWLRHRARRRLQITEG